MEEMVKTSIKYCRKGLSGCYALDGLDEVKDGR